MWLRACLTYAHVTSIISPRSCYDIASQAAAERDAAAARNVCEPESVWLSNGTKLPLLGFGTAGVKSADTIKCVHNPHIVDAKQSGNGKRNGKKTPSSACSREHS